MSAWKFGIFPLSGFVFSATFAAAQERIEISEGALTLSAPSSVSCSEPPEFTLEGPAGSLFAEDRSSVDSIVSQMATGLAQSCPDIGVVSVSGKDRGVSYTFQVRREDGWRLDPPAESTKAEAEPKQAAQTPTQSTETKSEKAAAARPEISEVKKPEIKPGLSFAQFAAHFGPVPSVRGFVSLENNDIWSRVLAARVYAERPQVIQNDEIAVEVAERMLTPAEFQQFKGPLANKNIHQWSVFERRDLANRVRTQLAPGLDTRRQTGPIDVYHSVQIQLGEYDFDKGAFPLNGERLRQYPVPQWKSMQLSNAFGAIVLPDELVANLDQARQLDNYLRQRNDTRLHLAIFAQITPEVPPSLDHYSHNPGKALDVELKQIALFADAGLTQLLFDYTPALADRQARADQVVEYLRRPLSGGEDFVRAVATLNDSDAVIEAMSQAYSTGGHEPKKSREQVLAEFGETRGPTMMTFSGALQVGTYDPVRKVLPVQNFNAQHQQFQTMPLNFGMNNTFFPQVAEIPMTAEQAQAVSAAVASGYQLEFRLEAEMVAGSSQPNSPQYLYLETTHRPHRLILFSGRQGEVPAKRTVLLDVELPKADAVVPSLLESLRIDQ
ncbi:hypothetical protein FGK63_15110 [Ruegeria sediminis]|uniref:Uncharacterized protein n=1 Tax=Ruegeria sediminis TaxID=2583820 RepID=A0ABY2WV42_9RHOB|nr:hypothetical protein [Ruegeria sediminis]TMV06473.1 hypothetical protein FGK63_15110 [Ruegeria sediminis]